MGDLSKNLSRWEFACKCQCGFDTVDSELVKIIQAVCNHFGSRVAITSGCRCLEYNRSDAVGSNDNSQHPKARAADCLFTNATPRSVYRWLCENYKGKFGFGLYVDEGFVHIDTRTGAAARWGEIK